MNSDEYNYEEDYDWYDEANWDYDSEDNLTDVEADAMTLASCGWGTDEDYFHDDGIYWDDFENYHNN